MTIENINPLSIDWSNEPIKKIDGETGFTLIKQKVVGSITLRQVEYSKNYFADHWCDKGHIVYVLDGELLIEHKDNSIIVMRKDMTYLVGDNSSSHKAKSLIGAKILIID